MMRIRSITSSIPAFCGNRRVAQQLAHRLAILSAGVTRSPYTCEIDGTRGVDHRDRENMVKTRWGFDIAEAKVTGECAPTISAGGLRKSQLGAADGVLSKAALPAANRRAG